MVAQGQVQCFRLSQLVELRAGCVGVDVADLLRLEPRFGQCATNSEGCRLARGERRREVVGIRRGAVAGNLGEDPGATPLGGLGLLEDQDAGRL